MLLISAMLVSTSLVIVAKRRRALALALARKKA